MGKLDKKTRIPPPPLGDYDALEEYFSAYSAEELLRAGYAVDVGVRQLRRTMGGRNASEPVLVPSRVMKALRGYARRRRVSASTVATRWLTERLVSENALDSK